MVAAPAGWEEPVILLAEELGCGKVSACVTGGESRTASVRHAVAEIPEEAAIVLVHDSARPLVPEAVIETLIDRLAEGWDGAVPGLPVADTVKRVVGGAVATTLDRDELVLAQTPQAFVATVLREALAGGDEAGDCAALVERRGGRVAVTAGDRRLLKVTTPEDLEVVSSWL